MADPPPPATLLDRARDLVRRRWRRLTLRGVQRADAHRRLDLLYRIRDPWGMETDREALRFAETNRLVREKLLGPRAQAASLLEIGCGEGHQSEHLARLAEHFMGIDVSATAVARARERMPDGKFVAGDLLAQPWIRETDRFDVVTACEVLYYVKDIPAVLEAMSRVGRTCLVTYFEPLAGTVEPSLAEMPVEGRERFAFGDTAWVAAWWRKPPR